MADLASIVLAAGLGKRMKSALPKPLHCLCGQPLLRHVLAAMRPLRPAPQVVVVGVGAEQVQAAFPDEPDLAWAVQEQQLGTGHAAACARSALEGFTGDVLVTCADIPLVQPATWERVLAEHRAHHAAATIVTAMFRDPTGYGRVIRDENGAVRMIVEEADCDEITRGLNEGNVSVYCFRAPLLFDALRRLQPNNEQGEYYLTDVIGLLVEARERVIPVLADAEEVMGLNDRAQLARAEKLLRARLNRRAMLEYGVTLIDPDATYIDGDVTLGRDTVIYPGALLTGRTKVGEGCTIGAHVLIEDSEIGDGTHIRHGSVVRQSQVGAGCLIGPFAHVRDHSTVGDATRVGNGEIVRSHLGEGVKDLHFSYLGDTTVGAGVNIGAGVITCNYDGQNKSRTIIGDGAFIGSDAALIAPVTIGPGAYLAAGSVITQDVPAKALAIGRSRQENKEGWAERLKK